MKFRKLHIEHLDADIEISSFGTGLEVSEWHVMIHVTPMGDGFPGQHARLCQAARMLQDMPGMQGATPIFKRYFMSDSTNQQPLMDTEGECCTVSCIQQPPLDGSKVALWMYLMRGVQAETIRCGGATTTIARHGGYEHLWTMGMTCGQGDSYGQTEALLDTYQRILNGQGADIQANCIRTWFFVRDVDTQYHGLVAARRDAFSRIGLTSDTHYIASTGIGGNPADTRSLVQMGCYAVKGLSRGQQRYLYAPTHLNRTYEYGVTFERGTLVRYGDRNHAYISGTASIDNKGNVVHLGNVREQTLRMWENVSALLREAGMTMDDMAHAIVYLRDIADHETVRCMFAERFPDVPTVITLAPVCRPTWLIEMECVAIKEASDENKGLDNL